MRDTTGRNGRAYDAWSRFAAGRGGAGLIFAWAFGEATVWPVIPDLALAPLVAVNGRRPWGLLGAAVAGMAFGGTLTSLIASRDPDRATALLRRLPLVRLEWSGAARTRLAADPVRAFALQPWSGIPFKVWAVEAGRLGVAPRVAIPAFVLARAARMAAVTALACGVARGLGARLRGRFLPILGTYTALATLGWWGVTRGGSAGR